MSQASRRRIVWFLIAALAIISGAGEGLHFIPGCGHGVEVGGRVLLLGIDPAGHGAPNGTLPGVARSDGQGVPIWDKDDCAICSMLGQCSTPAGFVQFILVAPLAPDLSSAVACAAPSPTPRLCQARAPPLA